MAEPKLKRRSQHEISHLNSKDRKISDDKNTRIEFNDICDNVIDIILCHLKLEDLANISDTNKRLKNIAGSVFSRKHAHRLISFDTYHHSYILSETQLERLEGSDHNYCKHEPIVRIRDANISFKLMRNFGEFIKFIRIQCKWHMRQTKIPSALENLFKYILEYCADSLEILELQALPYFSLNKPLTKLQNFLAIMCFSNFEAMELMPNLRSLELAYVPKTLEKYFPNLERVSLTLRSGEEVHLCISFLQMNRQIKYLKLFMFRTKYNNLIYSSIEENLTHLKTLKISDGTNTNNAVKPIRFKTIESFAVCGPPRLVESIEFDNLNKLHFIFPERNWIHFVLRNKNLKILKFTRLWREKFWLDNIKKLLDELLELEQIIVKLEKEEYLSILKGILGSEWEQIQVEEIRAESKSKFRRIHKKL